MATSAVLALACCAVGHAAVAQPARVVRPPPANASFSVELPGPRPARFEVVAVALQGAAWVINGCELPIANGACHATQRVVLTAAQGHAYAALWQAAYATPRCEPAGHGPGDRAYAIDTRDVAERGWLPADRAQVAAGTAGPCRAYARLAYFVAERFTASTP